MSYVDPKLREQFESLPIRLKDAILEQNVELHTMNDMMNCLQGFIDCMGAPSRNEETQRNDLH